MGREGELYNEYNLLCPGKSIAQFSRGIEGLPQWIRSQWMRMFGEKNGVKVPDRVTVHRSRSSRSRRKEYPAISGPLSKVRGMSLCCALGNQ